MPGRSWACVLDGATGELRVAAGAARSRSGSWSGCRRCRRRCGSRMRRGRRGMAWRGRARRRGSRAWWRRRAGSRARREIGSRPIGATRSGWRGCCGAASWWRCACRRSAEEAARDLVRAREDARGDLMRARHRLSKLLLRHGLVWMAARHGRGARCVAAAAALRRAGVAAGIRRRQARCCRQARRDALDRAIIEMAGSSRVRAIVGRLGCLRGVSVLTAVGLCGRDRRLAAIQRPHDRRLPGPGRPARTRPAAAAAKARSPRPAITHARRLLVEAAWHHRRPLRQSQARSRAAPGSRPRSAHAPTSPRGAFIGAGSGSRAAREALHARRGRRRARARRLVLEPRRDGVASRRTGGGQESAPGRARSDPRHSYEQPSGRRSTLDQRAGSRRTLGHAVPNPRISASTARRQPARRALPTA